MTTKFYIMGAAAAALLVAGSAQAASGRYAEPSQPIAYGKLNSYMKASPSKRASGDWTNTAAAGSMPMASTGSAADTSATVPAPTSAMDTPAPSTPQPAGGQVNNPPSTSDANAPMQSPAPADASGQTDGSSNSGAPMTAK